MKFYEIVDGFIRLQRAKNHAEMQLKI